MFCLSFLLFSALYIDGQNYVKIYRSSSAIDLFFIEQGFFSPVIGSGIVGADLNPATLGKSGDVEFFTAFSLPGVSSNDIDSLSLEIDSEGEVVNEGVYLTEGSRLYGQYRALGGVNFIGFSKRLGRFGVGISYRSGYKLGVEASLSGSIYGNLELDEAFEFTHEDFSEIPEGEVVNVTPRVSGGVSLVNPVPLRVEYSDSPIFLGGGTNFGPIGLGVGLKFQNCRLMGEGRFSARVDSFALRVDSASVLVSEGEEWTVEDFSAELEFDDSLFGAQISSTGLSATNPVFSLGTNFDLPILNLSFGLDLGGSYDLSGGYEWRFSAISDLPEDFVDVDTTNLEIDSVNNYITGRAIITIDSVIYDEESDSDDNLSMTFAGSSFNFGVLIDLPLKLGFNGRLGFPASDYSFNKLGACLYSRLPVPVIGVDLGLAADMVILTGSEVDEFIFVPSATVGMSFSYERDYLGFYLPVKYDISHVASTILNNALEENEGEDVFLDMRGSSGFWDNLAFGLGFKVKM